MKNGSNNKEYCDDPMQKKDDLGLNCPANRKKGQPVSAKTVRHISKKEKRPVLHDKDYFFCKAQNCSIVYFHPGSGQTLSKKDLMVRVGLKETEDPIWVCYCFDISKRMIQEEIESAGKSSLGDRIRQEVADKNCDCETLNPSGRCCLGEVLIEEKEALKTIVENQ